MTAKEMKEKVMATYKKNAWEEEGNFYHVGIRFENKKRMVGEICDCSRHNPNRENERDFPDFGAPSYEELQELDGTSAWGLPTYNDWGKPGDFIQDHCYIIAGNYIANVDDGLDDGEIVIKDAVVVGQVF